MVEYVTVFDSKYLPKALTLLESMRRFDNDVRLHCLFLDEECKNNKYLKENQRNLPGSYIWDVPELQFLKLIKDTRSYPEFCWTLASVVTWYMTEKLKGPIVYLDSDLYFFEDPKKIIEIIGDKEVAITPHYFLEEDVERLSPNGLYNVGYVYFSGRKKSKQILFDWVNKVIMKRNLYEGCGDQKYLDEWPSMLGNDLCILPLGVGSGPWHIRAYETKLQDNKLFINDKQLMLYHFHAHWRNSFTSSVKDRTGGYQLNETNVKYIYQPYEEVLTRYMKG